MKKHYRLLSVTVMLITLVLFLSPASSAENGFDPYSAFRLHIIANSDSAHDQEVKLAVRDALLEYERELFSALPSEPETAEETRALLMSHGAGMLAAVKATLAEYGDMLYPAGEYQALRVVLGNGSGKNWWCVMFPPLCIVEDDSGKSDVKPQDGNTETNGIELKSFFKEVFEWIEGIFSKE